MSQPRDRPFGDKRLRFNVVTLPSLTRSQIIDQLDSGYKWNSASITYSFALSSAAMFSEGEESADFVPLQAAGKSSARLVFQLWDDLITPSLVEISSGSSYENSDVEIGGSLSMDGYAWAYYPTVGSVWLNLSNDSGTSNLVAPEIGQDGFITYIHEIGHALGLDHMGDYDGDRDAGPVSYQDSTYFSVMSYFGPGWGEGEYNGEGLVAWADWKSSDGVLYAAQTPMLNDIMTIQEIYGADTTTRTGDTIYGFNSNIDGINQQIFDFKQNAHPIITIYDAGGNDTLDLSGWSTPVVIDLAAGAFSSGNGMTDNIAVAYNTDIENAVGGSGTNKISGNALSNRLVGGVKNDTIYALSGDDEIVIAGGDDFVDGGDGFDVAWFGKPLSKYQFTTQSDALTVRTGDGVAELKSIEAIEFDDYTISVKDLFYGDITVDFSMPQKFSDATAPQIDSVIELYTAYFNRIPEASGLKFWTDQLVRGESLNDISKAFYSAGIQYSEQTGYSASMTNDDFVELIYSNVLGRSGTTAPGEDEVAFWAGALKSGAISKEALIQNMLSAARSYADDPQWGWVTDLLDNKIAVGRIHSVDFGVNYKSPEASISETMAVVEAVTPTSIGAALKIIGIIDGGGALA